MEAKLLFFTFLQIFQAICFIPGTGLGLRAQSFQETHDPALLGPLT